MTQPLTRDLGATIAALEIAEAELTFQADRLGNRTKPSTELESEHLADLKEGYEKGARYVGILLNYHKGRMSLPRRTRAEGNTVDHEGTSGAYVRDEG
jgi:hypothetical protein